MPFFEFPHTRTYDNDLGWLIAHVIRMSKQLENFINFNTIKYADPIAWNITTQYEANTVVINPADGTAYISTKPVPSGVLINNTDYWTPIFNYGESMNNLRAQIAEANEETSPTATRAYTAGDLLWSNGKLYEILYDIPAGTAFIEGVNMQHVTVEGLLDDMQERVDETYAALESMKNAFIDGINVVRTDYNSTYTGRSRVYYAIIPKEHRPKMAMAGNPGTAQYPENFLPDTTPTIMVNASTFYQSTGIPQGLVINDGKIIQENNLYDDPEAAEDHFILYMDGNGELQAVPAVDHTATQVKAAGAVWAITAWEPIVLNSQFTGESDPRSAHPRAVIGQNANRDYIVLACDGRLFESRGMSYTDIYNFVQSIGFAPRILFNLDGGGSTAFYSAGVRINTYNNEDHRMIPNVIYFDRGNNRALMTTQKNQDISKYWADEIATTFRPTINAINVVNMVFKSSGINGIRAIRRSLDADGRFVFTDMFKLARDPSGNSVYLDGVTDHNRSLFEFLPGNVFKVFGQEVVQWGATTSEGITTSVDLKTVVKAGVYHINHAHTDNPTGEDGYVIVLAYGTSRYQIIVTPNHICGREVVSDGSYASAWVMFYGITRTSVNVDSASGISGYLSIYRGGNSVQVEGDVTVGTLVASSTVATGLPHPKTTVAALLMFSNNTSVRMLLDTSGVLKLGSNVTPPAGSVNEYAHITINYLAD